MRTPISPIRLWCPRSTVCDGKSPVAGAVPSAKGSTWWISVCDVTSWLHSIQYVGEEGGDGCIMGAVCFLLLNCLSKNYKGCLSICLGNSWHFYWMYSNTRCLEPLHSRYDSIPLVLNIDAFVAFTPPIIAVVVRS